MRAIDVDSSVYSTLLREKQHHIATAFNAFELPAIEVFPSPPLHFRMRAEFRVWHDGDDLYHIMFDTENKESYRVDQLPSASKLINQVMAILIEKLRSQSVLRHRLFQIDYLSTTTDEILVTLIYHRQLDDNWSDAIDILLAELRATFNIHIIGRARKQKWLKEQNFVTECLTINARDYQFQQIENSFTQPNAAVNCKMIEWALAKTNNATHDLLELYCGLGNFTIPLAQNFNRVLATEISKTSVAAATTNMAANDIDNITVIRMSSEELTQAFNKERVFKRLEGVDLETFNCQTILVDPPRSGVDPLTLQLVSQYHHIIYISCNPDTLARDLEVLVKTHDINDFALFDQFPYTHHIECGAYLTKRC